MIHIFRVTGLLIVCGLLFLSGCSKISPKQDGDTVNVASDDYYRMDFENVEPSDLRLDLPQKDSFRIMEADDGSHYAAFTIDKGDMVNSGTRCEMVIISRKLCRLKEAYYSWSLRLGDDYPDEDRWQLFAQWHDQPDEENGYNWQTKPPTFPPISLRCKNRQLYVQINRPQTNEWYLGPRVPIPVGQWVTVLFHIKWSMGEDGFVEAWVNDQPLTPFNGTDHRVHVPTLYNSTGNYLKLGNYRHNAINGPSTVEIDDIAIGSFTRPGKIPLPTIQPLESREHTDNRSWNLLESPINISLAKWPMNRSGAISITYDGAPGKPNEFAARKIVESYGLRIDYELVTSLIHEYASDLELMQDQLIPAGYQFFGHGHRHVNHDRLSMEESKKDFTLCYQEMEKLGLEPVAYAYPEGAGHKSRTQEALNEAGFLSGRMHNAKDAKHPYITPDDELVPENWFALPALVMQDITVKNCTLCCNNHDELVPFLIETGRRNAWLIVAYHALGDPGTYGWYPMDEFRKDMEAISRSDLYPGSMNDITKYVYERQRASLSVQPNGPDQYLLTLTDGLSDERLNFPLTLIFRWPQAMRGKYFRFETGGKLLMDGRCTEQPSLVNMVPNEQPVYLSLKQIGNIDDDTNRPADPQTAGMTE